MIVLGLAENDRQLPVQGDAMAQMRSPILISFDRFFHERSHGGFAILGSLFEANDKFFVGLYRFGNFLFKCVYCHRARLEVYRGKFKVKMLPSETP